MSKKADQINLALMFKKGPEYVAEKTKNGEDKVAALSFLMALLEKQKVFLGFIVETVFLLTENSEGEDMLVANMTKSAINSVAQHLNQLAVYFSKDAKELQAEAIEKAGIADEVGEVSGSPNYAKIPEYFLKKVLASVYEMQADLLKLGTSDPMSVVNLDAIKELREKLLGAEYNLSDIPNQENVPDVKLPVLEKPARIEEPIAPALRTAEEIVEECRQEQYGDKK